MVLYLLLDMREGHYFVRLWRFQDVNGSFGHRCLGSGQDRSNVNGLKRRRDLCNGICHKATLTAAVGLSTPCCEQGLLIEPNLQEFDKIPAKRPNAIAVNAAICSQEQLVHFVGKGSVIPMAGNSAGMQQFVFHLPVFHVLLTGSFAGLSQMKLQSKGRGMFFCTFWRSAFRQPVRSMCAGQLQSSA